MSSLLAALIRHLDSTLDHAIFRPSIKYLRLCGLWPTDETTGWRYHLPYWGIRLVLVGQMYEVIIEHGVSIALNLDQPLRVCENLVLMTVSCVYLSRMCVILLQPTLMKRLVEKMQSISDSTQLEDEVSTGMYLHTRRWIAFLAGFFIVPLVCQIATLQLVSVCFLITNKTEIRAWQPFDTETSPNLELYYLKFGISETLRWSMIWIVDLFMISLLIQAVVLFKILRHRMENLRGDSVKAVDLQYKSDKEVTTASQQSSRELLLYSRTQPLQLSSIPNQISQTAPRTKCWTPSDKKEGEAFSYAGGHNSVGEKLDGAFSHFGRSTLSVTNKDESLGTAEMKEGEKLRRLFYINKKKRDINLEMERRLKDYIKQHQELLSFIREFEAAFHWAYTFNFLSNIVPAGCIMLYLTKTSVPDMKHFIMVSLLGIAVGILFLHCFIAETLATESSKVGVAVYACDWTGASESFKKAMGIIISRSNQPSSITVVGNVPLSLATFESITKTSYSYYTTMVNVS